MKLEIKVPSVGESVTEAEIEKWEKKTGDFVQKGEILTLLETDKASMELPAAQSGKLTVLKGEGAVVAVGEAIGFLELSSTEEKPDPRLTKKTAEGATEQTKSALKPSTAAPESSTNKADLRPQTKTGAAPAENQKAESGPSARHDPAALSPAVRHLIGEHRLDPQTLTGTGKGGRLTKGDILKALNEPTRPDEGVLAEAGASDRESAPKRSETSSETETSSRDKTLDADLKQAADKSSTPSESLQSDQYRERMTRIRKRTAEKLVLSQQTSATLSTFNEADMSKIMDLRKKYQELFIKKHGVKLGFMSFFVKAVTTALKDYPRVNAFIDGDDIVYNKSCHIGIAVSTDKGLVVPVIRGAESLSFSQIEEQIIQYSVKAKNRQLTPDDLSGGTFTVSNGGVFGSLLSTPILNPPQSGILGMHKIEPRPVALNNQVVIRAMMYITLSYDHRIIDGRESVCFLAQVKEYLEDPARILIDI